MSELKLKTLAFRVVITIAVLLVLNLFVFYKNRSMIEAFANAVFMGSVIGTIFYLLDAKSSKK